MYFTLLLALFTLFIGCGDKSRDDDGDGYFADEDCDDRNPDIHPNAKEYCDGIDNNCDGVLDDDNAVDAQPWFVDNDGDGDAGEDDTIYACEQPENTYLSALDCDDNDATTYPGADEVCDGKDNDCAGDGDLNDVDGDGYIGMNGDILL